MPVFLLLLVVPLTEIAVFIVVGREIGLMATLLITLGTAVAGTFLLRRQGMAALERIRAELAARRLPARALADGAMIAAAGVFLLTPGFVTDTLGILLFVPGVRGAVWRHAARRVEAALMAGGRPRRAGHRVIDLDARDFEVRAGAPQGDETAHRPRGDPER